MKINNKDLVVKDNIITYKINRHYDAVYGFGEKFDNLNEKGKIVKAMVKEKCFYQGEFTYLSMPFFVTPNGFGIYVDTYVTVDFDFTKEDEIVISYPIDSFGKIADIYLFEGTIKEMLYEYHKIVGFPKVFPKWSLGAWMSSNRWRNENDIYEQLDLNKKYDFPHNVMVIERWSDLTTRYLFNETTIKHKEGNEFTKITDIDFSKSSEWKNPLKMVNSIHDNNLKVLLWLVPIYAQGINLETENNVDQALSDNKYAKDHEYVAKDGDNPYLIPHTWCIDSMIPDFTNKLAKDHFINHFRWLVDDLHIDGFKTDGGEFVHNVSAKFSDGSTGLEMQNKYCEDYTKAFSELIGEKGIVFSRAGNKNTPTHSIVWAGDQESTWSEFRSIVKAGITASLSGCSTWGFDISGFSGYLPSKELYYRSVQFAVFAPIMQWHSDPITNNRIDFSGAYKNNDRSPWNISKYYKDDDFIYKLKKHFNFHYNLLPYQYSLMLNANKTGVSSLRALAVEFENDKNTYSIDDEVMLGDALVIKPVLDDYIDTIKIYLPVNETWYNFYTGEKMNSGYLEYKIEDDYSPLFMRNNSVVPLNLHNGKIMEGMTNKLDNYDELTFILSGNGEYSFLDDLGNDIKFEYSIDGVNVTYNKLNTKIYFKHIEKDKIL